MPGIHDVVLALERRPGVEAVVVVGRDGLPIDSRTRDGVDPENIAALVPGVLRGADELGVAGARGEFSAGILEFGKGLAVVAVLSADAWLVVLVQPATNVGALLFEIRRHRAAIAGLL
jgi:predicted regulator of Ras-like GTPase activity (Roadblock/LC7/MglB family)